MTTLEETTIGLRPGPEWTHDVWDSVVRVGRRDGPSSKRPSALMRSLPWIVPAVVTGSVASIGLGRPGLWTDELATWGMATTPWDQFWPVLRYVDAVLAPYYVFMHLWVSAFGASDIALRLPSLLAMVGSAAMIGLLGRRLFKPSVGLVAGIVFAVLPSTTRFAAEARPFALAAFVACFATLLLLRACDRPGALPWLGYGITVVVLGWLHVVALLLLAGHAWTVLAWRRRAWWRFAAAASAAALASVPILIFGVWQRQQVAYIPSVGFDSAIPYGQVLFGGLAVAVAVVVLALFSLPLRFPAAVFTAWAVVPAVALILVSQALPMFLPRYLVYTTPAWALLAGASLVRWRPPAVCAAIAVLTLLALPTQIPLRAPGGHSQATNQIAVVLNGNVQPGDAIAYADTEPVGSWTARDAVAHYVPADQRLRDVLAIAPQRHNGQLLATECPDPSPCLLGVQRLWVLRMGTLDDPLIGMGVDKETVLRQQFQVVRIWYPAGITLALLQRIQPEA